MRVEQSTPEQPVQPAPEAAQPRARKPRPPKKLPRGITVVKWENSTMHDSVRYRVRIKRKDFKADELFETMEKAQEFLLMSKTKDGRLGITERERQAQAMADYIKQWAERRPFGEYLADYIRTYVDTKPEPNMVKKRSKETLRSRLRNLGAVVLTWKPKHEKERMGFFAKHGNSDAEERQLREFYLDEIDVSVANDFLRQRTKTHAPSTVKRELGDLQTIWSRLEHLDPEAARRYAVVNPWRKADETIIADTGDKRERHLTEEEELRLLTELAACRNKQMPDIVALALATGMRRGEVLLLEWGQLDMDDGLIRLAPSQTKGKRARYVSLTPEALEIINDRRAQLGKRKPKDNERLFTYTPDGFNAVWRRVIKRAQVADVRFHDTRRVAITRMLRAMSTPSPVMVAAMTGMQSVTHIEREFVEPFAQRQRARSGTIATEADIRERVGHSKRDPRMTQHYASARELAKRRDD